MNILLILVSGLPVVSIAIFEILLRSIFPNRFSNDVFWIGIYFSAMFMLAGLTIAFQYQILFGMFIGTALAIHVRANVIPNPIIRG